MTEIAIVAFCSVIAMTAAWFRQQQTRNAGIVDIVWSIGMMLAGIGYAITGTTELLLKICLGLITGLWFLRLSVHLYTRYRREAEDGRYQYLRNYFGAHTASGFFVLFQLQAGFIVLLSLPFWAVAQNHNAQPAFIFLALAMALFALWGESTADRQLAAFRHNPSNRGKTCQSGLWRYSRHPNYFFEWLHWFAYPLLGIGGAYQYYLWLAPLVMFIFLYYFTGIPFTEQQAIRSRGQDYLAYQKHTSMFFPWPPKSGHANE